TDILPMADSDHAPAFWSSVAGHYKDDRRVLFALYNEPHDIGWDCWLNGCLVTKQQCQQRQGCPTGGYQAAGMQSLVDAVRSAGARQPILLGGLAYANDLSGWLSHRPDDSAGQLVASLHTYDFAPCGDSCRTTVSGVAA